MFVGHFAVALAAKKADPRISLGTLFLSAQLVDLLWPLFLLLGIEHVRIDPGNTAFTPLDFYDYPITHSLIGAFAWSAVMAALYYVIRRQARSSLIVALCVFSHWILDFVTHRPDLPLGFTGTTFFGLGLWNSVPWTITVELTLLLAGLTIYLVATVARDRIGSIGFWALIITLVGIYTANIVGPPPPSAGMVAIAGNAAWLFVLWAAWIDRHRSSRSEPPRADR